MGSRGLGHLGGLLGRSVSHGLLAGLELPVLIVPDKARGLRLEQANLSGRLGAW